MFVFIPLKMSRAGIGGCACHKAVWHAQRSASHHKHCAYGALTSEFGVMLCPGHLAAPSVLPQPPALHSLM